MSTQYADYKDIDQDQLEKDIDDIKKTIGDPTQEDFNHLLKLERWGKAFTFGGFFLIFIIAGFEASTGFSGFWFWIFSIIAAISIGIGGMVGGGIFAVLGEAVSLSGGATAALRTLFTIV